MVAEVREAIYHNFRLNWGSQPTYNPRQFGDLSEVWIDLFRQQPDRWIALGTLLYFVDELERGYLWTLITEEIKNV